MKIVKTARITDSKNCDLILSSFEIYTITFFASVIIVYLENLSNQTIITVSVSKQVRVLEGFHLPKMAKIVESGIPACKP